jgi:hypothetical protein
MHSRHIGALALAICISDRACAQLSNTQSAELLEYQFNEVRGDRVANVASTSAAPAFGTVATTTWQTDPGRPRFRGNEAGSGCLAIDNAMPYDNYVTTGWFLDLQGSHTIMFWARHGGVTGTAYAFGVRNTSLGIARCWQSSTTLNLMDWGQVPWTNTASQPSTLVGWQHWCVVVDDQNGTAQWYLNGVVDGAQTNFTPNTFDLRATQLSVGSFAGNPANNFTRFFDMDDFRLYSRALTQGQIQIELASENPTTSSYDAGCTDSNGFAPRLAANGAPRIGNLGFALLASGLEPGRPVALYFGISTSLGGLLPLDLFGTGNFGAGCVLSVTPDVALSFASGGGNVTLPSPIPIAPTLAGRHAYLQLIQLSSGPLSAMSAPLDGNVQF